MMAAASPSDHGIPGISGKALHDCVLKSMRLDWKSGTLELSLAGPYDDLTLTIGGLRDLHVPRAFEWGPSVCINDVEGPVPAQDGLQRLKIEMQTGDVIDIVAASFAINARTRAAL